MKDNYGTHCQTCEYLRHDICLLECDHANGELWQWDQLRQKMHQIRKCFDVNFNRLAFIHQYQVIENLGGTETIEKDISRAKVRITMLAFEILFAIYSSITSIGLPMSQFQSNDFAVDETAKSNVYNTINFVTSCFYLAINKKKAKRINFSTYVFLLSITTKKVDSTMKRRDTHNKLTKEQNIS
ncbi:hypothetical protein RFI_03559 [Reticulomyxa filosa]|uniref:Uncharacterized protein n=1 Tax=Reticulomyxa filosa TaxID=46433 RepID=X6P627_RETFI|nr:hypothetical protein RFI_03559 [Reticulomyxa filosa]|eukprot:ETO33544.1 hypothetical protein RFI_03559 [Reticulomyxa filosa]